ncbi:hypothetical protein NFI96_029919, partial [Prochilodus magdalenae]
ECLRGDSEEEEKEEEREEEEQSCHDDYESPFRSLRQRDRHLTSQMELATESDHGETLYPDSAYGSSAVDTDTEESRTQSSTTLTYDEELVHKTILVGDSGVGKTSLLVQFDQGKFIPGSFSATVGIGFTVKAFIRARLDRMLFVLDHWYMGDTQKFQRRLLGTMSARQASVDQQEVKNGASRNVLERCASVNEYFDIAFKVMLLGDSAVGKTCVLVRFKDGAFLGGNFIATVGIDFREEQNEHCQSPTAVNVSDQTIRNRPHEGGLRPRRSVVGPVLTGQHRRARLAFATEHQNWQIRHRHLVLFTDESRFYLSTCDRRDRLWRRRGECYVACNIIQHDRFGGGSVMVWGGISLKGRTDLYRLDNGTLTAIRYQEEILGLVVRPYAGAVGPEFLLVHNNALPHVARVCRQFLENEGITIDWPTGSPVQVALQTVQELSDALVQIWEEIPQDTIHRLIRSIGGDGNQMSNFRMALKTSENKVVSVDNMKVKLQIWDTAGQERFRSVTHAYYRDAQALLLLYDITRKSSFDNIRAWLTEIHEYAQKDVVIMLLGNKSDMAAERVIKHEEGQKLAKEYGVPFMETSAKTGLNVELAFHAIARELTQRAANQPHEPKFQIHDYIESQKQKSSCCGGLM